MTKNYLSVISISLICAFSITQLQAQDDKTKTKVVVIEKTIDKDGNVEVKKEIKEGTAADAFIKEIELEESFEVSDKPAHKKKSHYKIVKEDADGNIEVIEWSGSGEVPDEIQNLIDKENVLSIDLEGEETKIIADKIEVIKSSDNRKAQLGVMIEETEEGKGVTVIDIIKNSAAEKAGIKVGDIITMVGDSKITSPEGLVNNIKDKEVGSIIIINLTRGDQDIVMKVPLQKPEMWKTVEKVEDADEIIIIRNKN